MSSQEQDLFIYQSLSHKNNKKFLQFTSILIFLIHCGAHKYIWQGGLYHLYFFEKYPHFTYIYLHLIDKMDMGCGSLIC